MLEPFILTNSIIIIDSNREQKNKDFLNLVRPNGPALVRQLISDGETSYLKTLNKDFPNELKKLSKRIIYLSELSFITELIYLNSLLIRYLRILLWLNG